MSKAFCNDTDRRISRDDATGVVGILDLIGSKVQVVSLTMSTVAGWTKSNKELFTIEDIKFRVQTDGKCHTLFYLKECPGRVFSIKDLIFEI